MPDVHYPVRWWNKNDITCKAIGAHKACCRSFYVPDIIEHKNIEYDVTKIVTNKQQ